MTDRESLWLILMTDQNCRKLEINRFLQLLVLAETINHLPYCINNKVISYDICDASYSKKSIFGAFLN